MSAPLFVIKKGATLLRSAIAGSAFNTNSRGVSGLYSNPRGLSEFDTLLMARKMEARSKLLPELKSDQEHYSFVMRKKSENLVGDIEKMNSETRSEFRDDLERKYGELCVKVEEIQNVFRNVFIGTALLSVSAVGLAVIDTQMQHKNS